MSVVWFEYVVADVERSKAFYGELLGWQFELLDGFPGEYWSLVTNDGSISGGLVPASRARRPGGGAAVFVTTTDLDDATERAVGLGSTVVQDVIEIAGSGRYVVVTDPDGNHVGLWGD